MPFKKEFWCLGFFPDQLKLFKNFLTIRISLEMDLLFAINLSFPLVSSPSAKRKLLHFESFAICSHPGHFPVCAMEILTLLSLTVQTFTFGGLHFLMTISSAFCWAALCAMKRLLVGPTLKLSFLLIPAKWHGNRTGMW